jgi:hypothetical protein
MQTGGNKSGHSIQNLHKTCHKNAIKPGKGVPSPKNVHSPYIPSPQKFGKNAIDPPPGFSNCVHLWIETAFDKIQKKTS